MDTIRDAIARLDDLRAQGLISEPEYNIRRKEVLDGYVRPTGGALSGHCARIRGLPFTSDQNTILEFLKGIKVDGIAFVLSADGRHSGQCYVSFTDDAELKKALAKDREYIGNRYVEIFQADPEEMKQNTQPAGESSWVRMRGLPYGTSKRDVLEFFAGHDVVESNIVLTVKGGRPSGEALVKFNSPQGAKGALAKDKGSIGSRYIELFMLTNNEADQLLARSHKEENRDSGRGFGGGNGGGSSGGSYGGGYGHDSRGGHGGLGGSGSEFIIKLRGLPFRATEADILQFLRGIDIAPKGIHMVLEGSRPSGEAYVELLSAHGLEQALSRHRQEMGGRWIEVTRADRRDVFSGGQGSPQPSHPPMHSMPQQQFQVYPPQGMPYPGGPAGYPQPAVPYPSPYGYPQHGFQY